MFAPLKKRKCGDPSPAPSGIRVTAMVARWPNFILSGVDATRKWPSEGFTRPWPDEIKMDPEVKRKIEAMWTSLGL